MPRKIFIQDPNSPYHITVRCNNRDWFDLPMDVVWEIFSIYLFFVSHAYGAKIHGFVLMNNHIHLIISFPLGNLSEGMNYFLRETSRVIAKESGRINHVYGARFFRSRLGSFHYFCHAYKYLFRNPVEANLVTRPEEYRFSTLHGITGQSQLIIPVEEDLLLFNGDSFDSTMRWLNMAPTPENHEAVRKALRHPDFHLAQCRISKKPHLLETALY